MEAFLKKISFHPPKDNPEWTKAIGAIEGRQNTAGYGYDVLSGGEREYYQIIKTTAQFEAQKALQGVPEYVKPFSQD